MNGNLYNDVMYVYTIGNEGNPKLDFFFGILLQTKIILEYLI